MDHIGPFILDIQPYREGRREKRSGILSVALFSVLNGERKERVDESK